MGLDMDVILTYTPGFDDPNKSDHVLLGEFFEYLQPLSRRGLHLSGIIYFHRINDTRMLGSAQRTLRLLTLCIGDQYLRHVRLCTTMWNPVDKDLFESREKQLKMKFWTELIDKGARVERFDGTQSSAWKIIENLVGSVPFPDKTNESQFDKPSDTKPLSEMKERRQAIRSLEDTLQDLQEKLLVAQRQSTESDFCNFNNQPDITELSTEERVLKGQIRIVEELKNKFLSPGTHHNNSPGAELSSGLSFANPTGSDDHSFTVENNPHLSRAKSAEPRSDYRNSQIQPPFTSECSSAIEQGRSSESRFGRRVSGSPYLMGPGSEEHIETGALRQLPEYWRDVGGGFRSETQEVEQGSSGLHIQDSEAIPLDQRDWYHGQERKAY